MNQLTPITTTVDGLHRITFQEQKVDTVSYIQNLLQVLCSEDIPDLHQPVLIFCAPKKKLDSGKSPSKPVTPKIISKQFKG